MEFYIAIDSGGTKTEFVLADQSGHILSSCIDHGCNPIDTGVDVAQSIIVSNILKLQQQSPVEISAIYAGIAGANHVDLGLEEIIARECGIHKAAIKDDRQIVVSSTLDHRDGCGMICGTGSSLFIIREGHEICQVGGLGYLIDTGGSGYELGQAGLKQTFRYLDGRGQPTLLLELLTDALGEHPAKCLSRIYAGGRPFIASLAHTVFEGFYRNDPVCREIVDSGSSALAELTYAAERYFDDKFTVVMTGGIFKSYPEYTALVREKSSPRADMIMASAPPVFGALVEAMRLNSRQVDSTVSSVFLHDYNEICAETSCKTTEPR